MIKLIASDMDGTLVADGSDKINESIYPLIKQLKEKHIYFVAASGRHFTSLIKLFEPVKDSIFFVSDNGASIQTSSRLLFSYEIKKEVATNLIEHIRLLHKGPIVVSTPSYIYVENGSPKFLDLLTTGYRFDIKIVEDVTKIPNIIKISLYDEDRVNELIAPLSEKWGEQLKVTVAGKEWIDVMDRDVSKGAAIDLLQDALDIKKSQTCVFGDQLNDIEMLKQAEFSFAVENAREETKQIANYICKSYKDDGVIQVLKEIATSGTVIYTDNYSKSRG